MQRSNRLSLLMCSVCLLVASTRSAFAQPEAGQTRETQQAVAQWRSLKYGMFIHFGMSTFTGRELDPGDQPPTTYAPTELDVDQWIRVARDAGMNYAVLTAKHVPGHCLWDSRVTWQGSEFQYDVGTSGDTSDVVAAFVEACEKYDILPGLYWCLLDWRNNSIPPQQQWQANGLPEDFYQLALAQTEELLLRYPTVRYLWLDIPRAASSEQRTGLYDHIKGIQPGCVVMFNLGTLRPTGPLTIGGFQKAWPTDILNTERSPAKPGWFDPAQSWQEHTYQLGYEHCDTIGRTWFWNEHDQPRSTRKLYYLYRQTVDAGGNLLLNVPPNTTGRIGDEYIEALTELRRAIDAAEPLPVSILTGQATAASNVYHDDPQWGPSRACDDDASTRWATDDGVESAWLEVHLAKPATFDRALLMEALPELERVGAFRIEYEQAGEWRTCFEGQGIGEELEVSFKPVTAQHVRLNILNAKDGPTIWEFQLFAPRD